MLRKQSTICLFIGYLGLLLNLGPSVHHAHFFGLHQHGDVANTSCDSCCFHAHLPTESVPQADYAGADHDCSFCKFFDQYHVIVDRIEHQEESRIALVREWNKPSDLCTLSLIPLARGPPAAG